MQEKDKQIDNMLAKSHENRPMCERVAEWSFFVLIGVCHWPREQNVDGQACCRRQVDQYGKTVQRHNGTTRSAALFEG